MKPSRHLWDVGRFSSVIDPLPLSSTLEMPGRRCRFVSWSDVGAENAVDSMAALSTSAWRCMAVWVPSSDGEVRGEGIYKSYNCRDAIVF